MAYKTVGHSPALLRLLKTLNQTVGVLPNPVVIQREYGTIVGRDKLLRIVQYLTRYLAFLSATRGLVENKKLFSHISGDLSYIRKSLRILKPLNHLANIDKALASSSQDLLSKLFSVAKDASFVVYLFFDNVVFLKRLQVVPKSSLPNAAKISAYVWSLAITFGLLGDIKNYYTAKSLIAKIKHITDKQQHDKVNALEVAQYKASRRFIWDALDLVIALNAAKILHTNEGSVALAGVATALLGYQDVWDAAKA